MKKISYIILILLIITIFSFINYKVYSASYNNKILSIISHVLKENPDINPNLLASSLKDDNINLSILKEYGYDKDALYLTKDIEVEYKKMLIINLLIGLSIILIYLAINSNKELKRKKSIEELISYLEKVNSGNYDINLDKYNEGELSKLRDQIYKTTILLKESENNLLNDKKNLKNNLADISHQLKTPLTSIILMLEDIIEDEKMKSSKKKEYINKISVQADKMKYLIEILLKVSKIDAGVVEFKKEQVNATDLINNAIHNLDYLINDKKIIINSEIDKNLIILCDIKWQEEALTNILKNSIENSYIKSKIDIVVKDNNFFTSITIKDYGKGISKEMQRHIFERFKKSENSNGIGIGLNLAKTIIEKDNAIIKVESVENKYTKFEIKYIKTQR